MTDDPIRSNWDRSILERVHVALRLSRELWHVAKKSRRVKWWLCGLLLYGLRWVTR